jgi:hypothetical protein
MKRFKGSRFTVHGFGFLVACALLVGATFLSRPVVAQDTTNAPTVSEAAQGLLDALKNGITNALFEVHGLYAPKLAEKYGFGAGMFWNMNNYIAPGLRIDWVNGGFYMPSGNVTLKLPITPIAQLPQFRFTPFTYAGVGIPLGGAKGNNGDPTAILGAGAAIHIGKFGGWDFDLLGDVEQWTGFEGNQYRGGLAFKKNF